MGLLAVLVAAAGGFAAGAVWYMTLAKPWLAAAGFELGPDGKPTKSNGMWPFLVAAIAMILVAGMMRHIFAMAGLDGPGQGLVAGLGIGAFFITPWVAMNYAYAARPVQLTVIDGGYSILGCAVIGLVLGLF